MAAPELGNVVSGMYKPPQRGPRTNLVVSATTFFGRSADLDAIAEHFAGGTRVVTLVGPGGIGKTSVAQRYGGLHLRDHSAVWFCDLTEARTLGDVCAATRLALGVDGDEPTDAAWVERLGRVMGGYDRGMGGCDHALVIVDNCEQVAEPAACALGRWRVLAPSARFLLTSREALRLKGERPHEIGPLALPGDRTDAESSEAVQLFVDRARAARPGYTLKDADVDALVALVRMLDGMPLAIELAAAGVAVLGEAALLQRLSTSLPALGTGPRDGPARHDTMRATIGWSWQMLAPHEKAALRQSAVFRGGFTAEAAEAVLDLSAFDAAPPVLEVLLAMRGKSLLRSMPRAPGVLRLGLYESIRHFAARELAASGEEPATQQRHMRYFLRPAEAWARDPGAGPPEIELADAAFAELENLQAAHECATLRLASNPADASAARDMLHATAALFPALPPRAPDSLALVEGTLESTASLSGSHAYGMLLYSRLLLLARLGRYEAASALHDVAMASARSTGDVELQAWLLWLAVGRAHRTGKLDEFRRCCEAALALGPRAEKVEPFVLVGLAITEAEGGRLDEAIRHFSEVLARASALEGSYRSRGAAYALFNRGEALQALGRFDEARKDYEQALVTFERDPRGQAETHGQLGLLLHEQGDLSAARSAYGLALRGLHENGNTHNESVVRAALGALLADTDELVEAERAFDHAERLASTTLAQAVIDVCRGHLDLTRARLCERAGDSAGAARHRADARQRLDGLVGSPSEVQIARRILERALRASEPARSPTPPQGALFVSPDARECRTPDGRTVDLSRRPRLRRLMRTLVQARLANPGQALGPEALFERAWPGESATYESSRGRVYVAVNALRELGLREVLQHDLDGYLLDPAVPIAHVPATPESKPGGGEGVA
jgi:predicted ATPase/Flp pilus assembly protein TadD